MSQVPRLVVRCFAEEDEALVEEWPVTRSPEEIRALLPDAAPDEIVEIDPSVAEQLAGRPLGPFSERVTWYLEPERVQVE